MAGSNYIHHAAGMLESMRAVAYEQFVIDNEIIGMALRLLKGIQVDDETLGFEAIREAGPSGNYLSSMHTVKFMRQEYFRQTLADRQTREAWEKSGALDGRTRARQRAKEILRSRSPQGIDHFFPRAYLQRRRIGNDNSLVNVTLVDDYLNKREIRARAPSDYMRKFKKGNPRLGDTMKSHLIDDLDDFGVWNDDYEKFLDRRSGRIVKELKARISG